MSRTARRVPPRLLLLAALFIATLALTACGGGSDDSPNAQTASPQDPPPAAPAGGAPISGAGPDLRVPGLAVYTKGVDLWLQRGDQAGLLLAGSQRVSLFTPALSPDGARVAYVRFDQAPGQADEIGSDIHILDLESGEDLPLRVHATGGEFFWSPRWDGQGALIYSHQRNETSDTGALFSIDIERIDLATSAVAVLRREAAEPDVSPDGALLAFVDQPAVDHILSVADLAAPETARSLLDTSDNLAFFRTPRFSPDGEWIAFLASGDGPLASLAPRILPATRLNGIQDVWLVRPDGSGLTRLTTVLEDTPNFAWSQDGRHILVRGAFGVYLVELATRVTQTLGPGEFHGAHDWTGALPEDATEGS